MTWDWQRGDSQGDTGLSGRASPGMIQSWQGGVPWNDTGLSLDPSPGSPVAARLLQAPPDVSGAIPEHPGKGPGSDPRDILRWQRMGVP